MAQPVSSTEIPSMADQDPDKLYVCPYNKYHRISAKIYPQHVANCRKMYPGNDYTTCPFNARHQFPTMEYEYHISSCPDKGIIEKEISSAPVPNVPQVNHHPEWNQPSTTEDWEAEADRHEFSLSSSIIENELRTAYDVIEDYQNELHDQATSLPPRPLVNGDMPGLSKAQRKNLKRAQKRREKRMTESGDVDDEEEEKESEAPELSAEEKERMLGQIARDYAVPGRQSDAFVDWVSILNQYCQKNKINQPKYSEATNPLGGFGSSVVVTTERFFSDTVCRTKKEAKHSAARAALLGLNIAVSVPNPCRAPHQRVGDVHRERELEANRQLLEQTIQANQERVIPGLSQPSATSSSNSSSREQVLQRLQSSSSNDTARLTSQMAGVNLHQRENPEDEWQVVGRRSRDSGRVPGATANNALRLAGRGRGRGLSFR